MMRRLGPLLICVVVFVVVSAVTRAAFHEVFDALGIDYEPIGGSRSDPKNPPGEFIAAFGSLAISAVVAIVLYRRLRPSPRGSTPLEAASHAPSSRAPANWYPDPCGQYELRYWDGAGWTEHVSTGGVQAVSPVAEP
jgi:hypothetical protein